MRTFIAANLPPETIGKIAKIRAPLEQELPTKALKWVSTHKMHLTIKFIGEMPKNKIPQVKAVMTNILEDQPPIKIGIQDLGTYPYIHNPRVIWLGITHGTTLVEIHDRLDHALQEVTIRPDRRKYSPHLTLARVRRDTGRETIKAISETLSEFKVDSLGIITIAEITLYESKLSAEGPEYTPLHVVSLNKV